MTPVRSLPRLVLAAALMVTLPACSTVGGEGLAYSNYALVKPQARKVADRSMQVTPPRAWNRTRPQFFVDIPQVEDWTLNGPLLDGVSFVAGLRDKKSLVRQYRTDIQQVPAFRSDMTAPEIAAMLESLFRVRAGTADFKTLALTPRAFLGQEGFQLDFEHLDSDEVWRKGRAVGAVVNGELYLILLDAARSHYYGNALPDFEALVASARRV